MLITLSEFARRCGKDLSTARHRAARGAFKTAQKIGRDWFVEDTEVWQDHRLTTGAYVGSRKKEG